MRPMSPEDDLTDEQRGGGLKVDLNALENQAKELYLHRFVEAVKRARGEHGRYLVLRSGDETAIRAAADGSADSLDEIAVEVTVE